MKKSGKISGLGIYQWLRKNKFPEGFRVLCHNCNSSFGHYGYCPHTSPTRFTKEFIPKLFKHGEDNGNSKFSKEQVIEIYLSKERQCDLAKKFNVNKSAIKRIQSNVTWKHVTAAYKPASEIGVCEKCPLTHTTQS